MGVCRVGNARLYFSTSGQGEPLLLLHGLGSSSEDWEFQVPEFSGHYNVITPDFRGFGGSSREGPFGVQQFASDTWSLLDHLAIKRIHLLGYSMGGAVAQQMVLDQPDRIGGLVLSNTLPSFLADSWSKRVMLGTRLLLMGLFGPRRLSDTVARKLFPRSDQAALREKIAERHGAADKTVYLACLRSLVNWSVVGRLPELQRSILVLAAEEDYFPRADVEAFAAALPRARLEILPGTRHGMPLGSPAAFNRVVLDYLQGQAKLGSGAALMADGDS